MLILFWILWLLDVLAALFGFQEFMGSVFGRYAAPNSRYVLLWMALFAVILLIIGGSLYFKNQGQSMAAVIVAVIPLVLSLPYILFLGAVMMGGKNNWR